jgi:hypothetical protein
LHSNKWKKGEKKKALKLHCSKNYSIEDLLGNEENGYQVPDCNKTTINVTSEPSVDHKKTS